MTTPTHFRHLCSRFATGVTVVTTFEGDDVPAGMTASSFASVSLDPPLISVAIGVAATIYDAMRAANRFTVNILNAGQEELARRFAAEAPVRFDGVGWKRTDDGFLVLDGALATIHCEKWSEVPAGDHTIVIGKVVGGAAAEHGRPLLYFRGGYADGREP